MKALVSKTVGGPETLELIDMPDPVAGEGEVVIDIKAAGANFPDTLIIRDLYQFKPERPFAPGNEVSGVVSAIGDGVDNVVVGDRVSATLGSSGAYATKAKCPAGNVMKIGDIPFDQAAAMVMTYGTSYHALKDRAQLKEGESLFILGAAGGVGSAAIELGKAMGARVVAGVSSQEKADFCREIGADDTVVYDKELDRDGQKAFSNQLKELSGGKGFDVVYDSVGGAYAEPCIRAMAWEGRFLVVGFPAGIPKIPLNLTLLKGCDIRGVFWGASTRVDPKGHQQNLADLRAMVADGRIKPRVTKTFPLEQGAEALRMLEERKATGKIVLTME